MVQQLLLSFLYLTVKALFEELIIYKLSLIISFFHMSMLEFKVSSHRLQAFFAS